MFGNAINVTAAHCSADMLPFATHATDGQDVDIAMFGGETDRLWVLNAGGARVLIAITDNKVDALRPVLASVIFGSTLLSPAAVDATFVSTRYGYSIDYPGRWSARPALADPGTIDNLYLNSDGPTPFDELTCGPYPPGCGDPYARSGTFFGIGAPAPSGLTPEEWVAANHQPACPSGLGDTVTIDGRTAFFTQGGCDASLAGWHYTVLLATDELVYRFQLTSPLGRDERFLAMLSSIRLTTVPPSN
jgi:hypothetical protein